MDKRGQEVRYINPNDLAQLRIGGSFIFSYIISKPIKK